MVCCGLGETAVDLSRSSETWRSSANVVGSQFSVAFALSDYPRKRTKIDAHTLPIYIYLSPHVQAKRYKEQSLLCPIRAHVFRTTQIPRNKSRPSLWRPAPRTDRSAVFFYTGELPLLRPVSNLAHRPSPLVLLQAQLEAKGVRRVALSALRDAGSGSATGGGGGGGETGSAFTEGAAATAGLLSPITPAPQTSSRSGAAGAAAQAATTVHRAASAGHGNANGGGACLTTATRRRRPTAAGKGGRGGTTSVLTRAGAGVPEGERGAPTPTGGEAAGRGGGGSRAGSPTALIGNSPRGLALGSGGEESAFSALEPLVRTRICFRGYTVIGCCSQSVGRLLLLRYRSFVSHAVSRDREKRACIPTPTTIS